ncbi:hypothetical protein OFO12_01650 [Campylobacter sp. JMF_04 NA10]|uniref:hypothetical protein n=1 Tax=Campylobacter sp. JMF_04 NA10 TaxID=2983824 RepID=UPI0022E9C8FF|nr:hypothetical protein [Campylobacter sp. JMF_04 NA10]MDA3076071.1 hypothetical protein [Campylobacter sp. JMF_04 NA10]
MSFKSNLAVALLGVTAFLHAEVSAFDAGNIGSDSSYGLTENEQFLRDNRKKVNDMQNNLNSVNENMEGLRTVVEGANEKVSNLESRVADLEIRTTGRSNGSSELDQMKKDIAWLKSQISEINAKLGNSSVKKNAEISKNTGAQSAKGASATTTNKSNFSAKDNALVAKEAEELFKKKDYTGAKERYAYLASKNYQPARSNYMLGEVAYFSGSYGDAINYYKKSISHNQKQDYTPRLLYHTAISFDKIGDSASGTKFYNALKSSYPDSKEAKAAPTR